MTQETLMLVQFFSIILAGFGTPGLTFWVMKRMSREALVQIKENCSKCKLQIDEKISGIGDTLHETVGRQISLREKLPIDYVRRDEFNRHLNGSNKPK
jgi:hypothetical protein